MPSQVTVTGAGGYIGRHVTQELLDRGIDVVAVTRSSDEWLQGRIEPSHILTGGFDALDDDAWKLVGDSDAVIHLAWRDGFVLRSNAHGEDLSAHYRFLTRAASEGVGRIAALGTMHEIGYWEGAVTGATPANPTTPYGIAKDALRRLVAAAVEPSSFAWLRCYYITGDDRRSSSIFQKLLAAADRGERTFPFTSGKNLYDFIDVDELSAQIVTAALASDAHGIIECCSGEPRSLASAVEAFIERENLQISLQYGAFPDRPFDSPGIWGDSTRIRALIGADPAPKRAS